ncbi:MAG: hypothetical protein KJZ78_16965 [Bryobacteraceae bacterium]|nr:hypothetical protein [Bryobacteraceae bacterium]HEU0141444.1 hypothetical protein [Bryobacteraceae bacterium]
MDYEPETPFDDIEGAQQYLDLLGEAVIDARQEIEGEIALAKEMGAPRREQALMLISYNLAKLGSHMTKSRRILNDLRTLRRLLLEERSMKAAASKNGKLA